MNIGDSSLRTVYKQLAVNNERTARTTKRDLVQGCRHRTVLLPAAYVGWHATAPASLADTGRAVLEAAASERSLMLTSRGKATVSHLEPAFGSRLNPRSVRGLASTPAHLVVTEHAPHIATPCQGGCANDPPLDAQCAAQVLQGTLRQRRLSAK